MTTVVYQEEYGKEYRPPTQAEINAAKVSEEELEKIADEIPHGIPDEPFPSKDRHRAVGSQLPDYGFKVWSNLFTSRQLLMLMTFVKWTRAAQGNMEKVGYSPEWAEAVEAYLAINVDRLADYASKICVWETHASEVKHTLAGFKLPMTWDFAEGNPLSGQTRYYKGAIEYVGRFLSKTLSGLQFGQPCPEIVNLPAQMLNGKSVNSIITDPPYYDALPYADLSDFFYVWLRRMHRQIRFPDVVIRNVLTPKISEDLVQQHWTFCERGIRLKQKSFTKKGCLRAFRVCLHDIIVKRWQNSSSCVRTHKDPEAWETLVNSND